MKIQYKLIAAFAVILIIVIGGSLLALQASQNSLRRTITRNQVILTRQMMEDIDREMSHRVEDVLGFGRGLILQETLLESNLGMEKMKGRDAWIEEKDRQWVAFSEGELSPFMKERLSNKLARELLEKQQFSTKEWLEKPIFPEIFVTNKFGVIVAATNRTSDYLQADEEWYQNALQQKIWVGELEYDQSSESFACAIAVKLFDENEQFAGVIKAVLNIEAINYLLRKVSSLGLDEQQDHSDTHVKLMAKDHRLIYTEEPDYAFGADLSEADFVGKIIPESKAGSFIMVGDLPGEGDELFTYAVSQGYRDYPGLGWITVVEHDAEHVFQLATSLRRNILIVIGFVSLVALLLTLYFSRLFAGLVASLNQAHFELNQIFQIAADGIRIVDREFNLVRVNETFLKMAKLENDTWQEKKCYEVFRGPHCHTPECALTRILSGEKNIEFETVKECHDGTKRHCMVTVKPYSDAEGNLIGMIEDFRDIGDRKKMEAEKQQMQSFVFQQEKLASVGQLAAGVAHEINNPIGFISSNLGSLQKYTAKFMEYIDAASSGLDVSELQEMRKKLKIDFIAEDIVDLIGESMEGTERVRGIVQNLKNFSRVEGAEESNADINECLESTIKVIWNELKYKATVVKEYGELPQISCFPQQLNQVFMNFLINAAHSIDNQGEIKIRTWQEDMNIMVAISDTGSGIAEKNLSRLFEPFFTTKEVGKGTGLGLSIAHEIIQKHHGEIRVESEVGKGTTFTVVLPINDRPEPLAE